METAKQGFWRRQFAGEPIRAQSRFDAILGLLMPVFCGYDSILTRYRWLAYTFIGVEIVVLALWLAPRRRLAASAAFFVGPLLAGVLLIGTPSLLILQAWHHNTLPGFMREAGAGLDSNTRLGG